MDWKELHAAIAGLGLTQVEIANKSGVPQPTICQVLKKDPAKSVPRLTTYLRLLDFYKKQKRANNKKVPA